MKIFKWNFCIFKDIDKEKLDLLKSGKAHVRINPKRKERPKPALEPKQE